jgi:TonB family protein
MVDMRLDSGWFALRILLGVILCAALSLSAAAAERVNLDEIADRLAAELAKANIKSAGVADFLAADGKRSDLGWYLAGKLSDELLRRDKGFHLLDRGLVLDTKVSAADIASTESLKRIGSTWGIEAILTGNVEDSDGLYVVTTTLRRTTDGEVIATQSEKVAHQRLLDLLSPEGADGETQLPKRAGVNGVGIPVCRQCPIPQYSDKARKAGIQSASVILDVTISAKGTVEKIGVIKGFGYGLTENAVEAVSGWQFGPALGADGAPVSVLVPVEVTFRSSRT